jgi:hypothetical protein
MHLKIIYSTHQVMVVRCNRLQASEPLQRSQARRHAQPRRRVGGARPQKFGPEAEAVAMRRGQGREGRLAGASSPQERAALGAAAAG